MSSMFKCSFIVQIDRSIHYSVIIPCNHNIIHLIFVIYCHHLFLKALLLKVIIVCEWGSGWVECEPKLGGHVYSRVPMSTVN